MTRNKHHISKPPECAASLPVVGGSGRRRQPRTGVRRLQEPAVDCNASYTRALLFCCSGPDLAHRCYWEGRPYRGEYITEKQIELLKVFANWAVTVSGTLGETAMRR